MGLMKRLMRSTNGPSPTVNKDAVVATTVTKTENWVKKAGGPTVEVSADFADGKRGTARGYSVDEATGYAYKKRK